MYVPVELSRIVITETSPQQIIFLKEKEGQRSFPIMIGIGEALAIDRRLKGVETPRPMTHDLLAGVIEALGGRLERILINDLRQHTFIATLIIDRDGETIEVDSRPSDAIALGIAQDTPIFVAPHVLEEVLKDAVDLAGQQESLQRRRDQLTEEIVALQRRLDDPGFRAQAGDEQTRALREKLKEMQGELEAIEEILRHLE